MNTRLALLDYCVRYQLDRATEKGLWQLAAFDVAPPSLQTHVRRGLAAVSALLLGIALICLIAANWSHFGRILQFGLLEGLVVLSCTGAALAPVLRTGLTLLAFLTIGALFAYFGQTYQTGADTWQLFALWSALSLPLAIVVRSEIVRVAWVVVTMTAIALWMTIWGCLVALLLAFSLSRQFQRVTRIGPYASGLALVSALVLLSKVALPGITGSAGHLTSTVLVGLVLLLSLYHAYSPTLDILALCSSALAFNFLLDTAIVSWTLSGNDRAFVAAIFVIAIASSALCGLTVRGIFFVMRNQPDTKGNQ
jgi:uncharacterized membrane protein